MVAMMKKIPEVRMINRPISSAAAALTARHSARASQKFTASNSGANSTRL